MSACVLNRHQARWSITLLRFDFKIIYWLRRQEGLTDVLSRHTYLASKERDSSFYQQRTILLKLEHFYLWAIKSTLIVDSTLIKQFQSSMSSDPLIHDIRNPSSKSHDMSKFEFKNNLLYFEGHLYIPKGEVRLRVLQACHNFPTTWHFEYIKTLELISKDFWWPQMWKAVKDFVQSYNICSRSKIPCHWPYRLLQPLHILEQPWSFVSMDFIINLSSSNSYDSIFVIVDCFTKMAHFVSCIKSILHEEIVKLFIDNIYRNYGLPKDIIFDRRTQFVSRFWRNLFKIRKVDIKLSLAFHP